MNGGSKVVPAILAESIEELRGKLAIAVSFGAPIQIDIMDGIFCNQKTVALSEIESIPHTITTEVQLMVDNAEKYIDDLVRLKCTRWAVHIESHTHFSIVFTRAQEVGAEVYIALSPETPIRAVEEYQDRIAGIMLMSVYPGSSGQTFLPQSLMRARECKTLFPHLPLEMDGGINEANIASVLAAGVDTVIVGSGIWGKPEPTIAFNHLVAITKTH